ncbi:MAG: hypothetical protein JXA46_10520 [Dehalococcoidales bacterium]|nr:hypothetical protein [Dehalococcoidales bacterium]
MKRKNNIVIYIGLVLIWVILLLVQNYLKIYTGNLYILISAVNGLVGLPLIVLVMVFLVGQFVRNQEKRARKRQLMQIKSWMFRLEMRNLFISNFQALKSPILTLSAIKHASLSELVHMREAANNIQYDSLEKMEPVIMEYAASQTVWRSFISLAFEYGFEEIFQDILYILHFEGDVKTFKESHPDRLFIQEAAGNSRLMQKVHKILGDGIRKFLDYAIELKEKQPELFSQIVADFELSTQMKG